ncbi:MAG: hypothetical protein CM15mP68_5370 [Pseudomonadota bacterium]|nr:MAG: hypothetical protein CM15mP68_5370 [Pseudomonadota bacterium]
MQRDLLPLIEGCTVSTKYGAVRTDHILFIASGAFHLAKPSDLIPELQGRLPIRVELRALTPGDFKRILSEPKASLCEQYQALLNIEGVELTFTDCGIEQIAELAWQVNEGTENIGARRLHTVMERLLEELSFTASDLEQRASVSTAPTSMNTWQDWSATMTCRVLSCELVMSKSALPISSIIKLAIALRSVGKPSDLTCPLNYCGSIHLPPKSGPLGAGAGVADRQKNVGIKAIEPVGNYAIRITFDDGHDSGIYAWDYLYDLGNRQEQHWQSYLGELKQANASRLPTIPVGQWQPKQT